MRTKLIFYGMLMFLVVIPTACIDRHAAYKARYGKRTKNEHYHPTNRNNSRAHNKGVVKMRKGDITPILLGQSVLSQLGKVSIDYNRNEIILE